MRQVFLDKGSIVTKEVAQPLLDDNAILVSVYYSFVSPELESEAINASREKNARRFAIPEKITKILESLSPHHAQNHHTHKHHDMIQSLGYSCSGKVIAVGKKVTTLRAGDLVACAGAQFAHHADIISIPDHLAVRISNEKFIKEASMIALAATALQAVRRARLQIGESVCVMGLGALGQIVTQLAIRSGCNVIAFDNHSERRKNAINSGACAAFSYNDPEKYAEVLHRTANKGVDFTFVTHHESDELLTDHIAAVTRTKGSVIIVGSSSKMTHHDKLQSKEVDVLLSQSYGQRAGDLYQQAEWTEHRTMTSCIDLIEHNKLNLSAIINDTINIEHAEKAYRALHGAEQTGIILHYLPKEHPHHIEKKHVIHDQDKPLLFKPAIKDSIRVGVVGVGKLSQKTFLPFVSQMHKTSINAIVDRNNTRLLNASRLYGAARTLTDATELLDDDTIDALLISSSDKMYYQEALHALQRGKAVFLERPIVTNPEQFETLITFLKKNPHAPFCVDYNRSFSPFIQRIQEATKHRTTPLMIQYRINAGYVPKKQWGLAEMGSGRILSEACHIFDIFAYLTNSEPHAVSVEALRPPHDDIFPTDNFSAHVSYKDGSVCTLLFTALGHHDLNTEYMEVHFGSKSIVMTDYTTLQGYGLPNSFDCISKTANKGHEFLLERFFSALREPHYISPISINRFESVAHITRVVDQLAIQGGGAQEL